MNSLEPNVSTSRVEYLKRNGSYESDQSVYGSCTSQEDEQTGASQSKRFFTGILGSTLNVFNSIN